MRIKANKEYIRQQCREQRKAVSSIDRQQACKSALNRLVTLDIFKQSNKIACYLSYASEFDTKDFIELIWQHHKHCYLPVIQGNAGMVFAPYTNEMILIENQYGIKEPAGQEGYLLPQELDLVFTPLLAFDRKGHRLGAGKGYYDKAFHQKGKVYMLGLAFACQEQAALPADEWDVVLDGILTEKEFIIP